MLEADDVVKNFSQATATGLENESVFEIATVAFHGICVKSDGYAFR